MELLGRASLAACHAVHPLDFNTRWRLRQVVADHKELHHLTGALRSWRMLPDFPCSDEGTRIGAPHEAM